jgi:CheY-like chemotaxis protein
MATYRIYLTDDDRFLLDMYAIKFKAAGHEVTVFQSGAAVLDALRTLPAPDALLCDIVMPEIDGFQVLETIKKERNLSCFQTKARNLISKKLNLSVQ